MWDGCLSHLALYGLDRCRLRRQLHLFFGHLLLQKWDSLEKSEKCWYQSCHVTVYKLSMKKRDFFLLLHEKVEAAETKTLKNNKRVYFLIRY